VFQLLFLCDIIVANLMLDISKLLIGLSCPALWSLHNNYHSVHPPPDTKCILDAEIQKCQAVNIHLLCNAKKVTLGIRSGSEGLRIFPIGADPKQELGSEKIRLLSAPDQSMQGIPPAGARDWLSSRLFRALHAWHEPVLSPVIATARVFQNAL